MTPGLDVTEQSGPIKWSQLGADFYFVLLRASQGTRVVDNSFGRNAERARDAGIIVVPYHVVNVEPAELQAAHFTNAAKLRQGSISHLSYLPERWGIARNIEKALVLQTRRTPIPEGLFKWADTPPTVWFAGTPDELREFCRDGALPKEMR